MKNKFVLIGLTILAINSCNLFNPRKGNSNIVIENGETIGYDILYNEAIDSITSLEEQLNRVRDSLISFKIDKISLENDNYFLKEQNNKLKDSLEIYKEDALVYKYKIERIKGYDKIVRNNSSQSKYFLGWVRRVLED